jgi:hypothetical protein
MIEATDINMLDWYGERWLNYIPVHFTIVKFRHNDERLRAMNWLTENTSGRFGIARNQDPVAIANGNRYVFTTAAEIGFEDPAEATMYSMFFH